MRTSLSRFAFVNRFRFQMQTSPAIENVLSIGAEDAGTTRTSQATFNRIGNNGSDFTQ